MTAEETDKLYLIHILECIRRVEEYVHHGREAFLGTTLIQDAVLRNLQVLAESTQRLSDMLKASNQQIEWRKIAGFRNILVHDYFGVDLPKVWEVVAKDLPQLKAVVRVALNRVGGFPQPTGGK